MLNIICLIIPKTADVMIKSKRNFFRDPRGIEYSTWRNETTRYRRRTEDPSIAFGTDIRKKARKKGESIIKLAFYSARERIEQERAQGWRAARRAERMEAEYKVTSHVYFIPVDPIKVPIIISDVFRCNMFDLVSDIL